MLRPWIVPHRPVGTVASETVAKYVTSGLAYVVELER